jgi:hypothetical protein
MQHHSQWYGSDSCGCELTRVCCVQLLQSDDDGAANVAAAAAALETLRRQSNVRCSLRSVVRAAHFTHSRLCSPTSHVRRKSAVSGGTQLQRHQPRLHTAFHLQRQLSKPRVRLQLAIRQRLQQR